MRAAKEREKRELAERLQAEAAVALAAKEREAEALREAVEAERQRLEALRQREAEGLRAGQASPLRAGSGLDGNPGNLNIGVGGPHHLVGDG